MKQLFALLCACLLLAGCAAGGESPVEELRRQILELPTVEEFRQLEAEAQTEVYNKTQQIYEEYEALTPEQKQQIPEAEEVFDALFGWFNSQVQPLAEGANSIVS